MDPELRAARPLVGRTEELARLRQALQQSRSGQTSAIFLCGDAGIGKTRLVAEFLAAQDLTDERVLNGSCVEFGSAGLPFGPFVELLRQVLHEAGTDELPPGFGNALGALVPGLMVAPSPDTSWPPDQLGRARLFGLALTLLTQLADSGSLVIVLEDIHWADETSLDLLRFLVANLRQQRVLLLATYRGEALHRRHPLSRLLADVARHAGVEIVEVPPLPDQELRQMVEAEIDDPFQVARVVERAEGSPFFAEALAAAVGEEEHLPRRLRDILLARLVALPEDVQHLVRVAAVAGRPVPDDVLIAVCDWPAERLLPALRIAVERQVLTVVGADGYRVRHALLQHAVYGDLLNVERRELHAAVAAALDDRLAASSSTSLTAAAELAHHWYESGLSEPAFWAGLRAARMSASVYAFAEADSEYSRVLRLYAAFAQTPSECPPLPLSLEAAEAARRAGHTLRALDRFNEALRLLDGADEAGRARDRAAVLERLGQCQWEAGRTDAARASYEEAAQLLHEEPASELRAHVLAAHARMLMVLDEFEASERLCAEATTVARSSGATGAATSALITSGVNRAMTGELEEGIDALRTACTAAANSERLDDLVRAYGNLAAVLSRAARSADSLDAASAGLELLADRGLPLTVGGLLMVNAVAPLVWLGRWEQAVQLAEEALTAGVPALHAAYLHQALAEVATGRGQLASAARHVDAVRELSLDIGEWQFVTSFSAAVAELRVWQGDHSRARAAVAEGLAGTGGHQEDFSILLRAVGLRAEANEAERRRWRKQEIGDIPAAAERLVAGAEQDMAALDGRSAPPLSARVGLAQCRAERGRISGRDDPALWRHVAEGWSSLDRVLAGAYARYREAEAWLNSHEIDRARAALSAARDAAERLGAVPLLREIDALAQRARLTPMPRVAPDAAPIDGMSDLLTDREREVVRLLVSGSTNREIGRTLFISEKTAGVHVSHILAKLQARNRVEAAAAALRLGLVDAQMP